MRRSVGAFIVLACLAVPCQAQQKGNPHFMAVHFPGVTNGAKNTKSVADLADGMTLTKSEDWSAFYMRYKGIAKCGVAVIFEERRDAKRVDVTVEMPNGIPPINSLWTADRDTWHQHGELTFWRDLS